MEYLFLMCVQYIPQSNITRLEPPYGQCSQEYADSFQDLYGYHYNVDVSDCIEHQGYLCGL